MMYRDGICKDFFFFSVCRLHRFLHFIREDSVLLMYQPSGSLLVISKHLWTGN